MVGKNYDDFTDEQVDNLIRNQGHVSPAMAKHLSRFTGRSQRLIITRSLRLSIYDLTSSETSAEARARFIEEFGAPSDRRWLAISGNSQEKIIYFAFVILMAGILAKCVLSDSPRSAKSSNPSFRTCEAELKPQLEKCTEGPESTWKACGDAYMREMKACTGK